MMRFGSAMSTTAASYASVQINRPQSTRLWWGIRSGSPGRRGTTSLLSKREQSQWILKIEPALLQSGRSQTMVEVEK
jgi:hypothetical protein